MRRLDGVNSKICRLETEVNTLRSKMDLLIEFLKNKEMCSPELTGFVNSNIEIKKNSKCTKEKGDQQNNQQLEKQEQIDNQNQQNDENQEKELQINTSSCRSDGDNNNNNNNDISNNDDGDDGGGGDDDDDDIVLPESQQTSQDLDKDFSKIEFSNDNNNNPSVETDSIDSIRTSNGSFSQGSLIESETCEGRNLTIEEKKNLKRILVSSIELSHNFKRAHSLFDLAQKTQKMKSSKLKKPSSDWPLELVLVRHGQSEGNEAVSRSAHGDLSAYTPEFKQKHSSTYRLTDKGILQAKVAGKWIRDNIGANFDRYYTSEYVRAMETSALLDLPDAHWYTEIVLRERDKGQMDNTSDVDKKTIFADELARRKRDAFFWSPPGGESLAAVCNRVEHTFNTLRRECNNQRVIIVCHGEVMWAFRVRIERLSQIRFHELKASSDPKDQIHNTQILHYSRIHPVSGKIYPHFRFVRSSCPWKAEYSTDSWMEFERPMYSNEELLESVQSVQRYVNNIPKSDQETEPEY